MKDQTFGVEVEFLGITRAKAAQVLADHFGTRVAHRGGTYDTREVCDGQGRVWKLIQVLQQRHLNQHHGIRRWPPVVLAV